MGQPRTWSPTLAAAAFAFAGMPERGRVRQTVWALTVLAWLGALSWSVYEVVLTRSLQTDNAWALPDGAVVGLASFLAAVLALVDRSQLKPGKRYGPGAAVIVLGATTVGLVAWAAYAPLPQQKAVPLPPSTASPQVVVRAFVAAVDEHDGATADALCAPGWASSANSFDLGYFVRLRITQFVRQMPDTNEEWLPKGVAGADVVVMLAGWTRDGGPVGEDGYWTYYLAPVGPHGAWRIGAEGMG